MTIGSLARLRGFDLPQATYVELVRSLFSPVAQPVLMTICFISTALLVANDRADRWLLALAIAATAMLLARLSVLFVHRREAASPDLTFARACRVEQRYAAAYLGFAALSGLWCARAFAVLEPQHNLVVTALLFGYCAGVAAAVSYRPWIGVPSVLLAACPSAMAALASGDRFMVAFLIGGTHSMLRRYRSASGGITTRLLHATLARHDHLTGLPNRLALREAFDRSASALPRGGILAVHCLDLDRFKPVNDSHGHLTGDMVLQAVAHRLTTLLRRDDIAARLGGDEFVLLQTGAAHPGEAEMLARRITRAISQPFEIGDHRILLGVSVGYALFPDQSRDLNELLARADRALYRVKQAGGGDAGAGLKLVG